MVGLQLGDVLDVLQGGVGSGLPLLGDLLGLLGDLGGLLGDLDLLPGDADLLQTDDSQQAGHG